MDYIYILGVKIHKIKKGDVLENIKEWLAGDKFHYITTVNPEFVIEAQKDEEFKGILNGADLSIPDGIGLKFSAWFFGENIYRMAGADLVKDILELSEQKSCSTYFFVWNNGLSGVEDVKDSLKHTPYPPPERIIRAGSQQEGKCEIDGQAIERDGSDIDWEKFDNFAPDILLVGLGAPYQEKLIASIKNKRSSTIKVAIGVGGTFDFLTGKIRRAPKIMRIVGLEWCYRMCQPPKPPHNYFYRIIRVLNAVLIFSLEVLKWKMKMFFN